MNSSNHTGCTQVSGPTSQSIKRDCGIHVLILSIDYSCDGTYSSNCDSSRDYTDISSVCDTTSRDESYSLTQLSLSSSLTRVPAPPCHTCRQYVLYQFYDFLDQYADAPKNSTGLISMARTSSSGNTSGASMERATAHWSPHACPRAVPKVPKPSPSSRPW